MTSAYACPHERCTDCKEGVGVILQVRGSTKESKTCIFRLFEGKFNQFSPVLNKQQRIFLKNQLKG